MKTKDWLAFICLGSIWGSSFLWIKIAVTETGPLLLVAFRLLFGLLALILVAWIVKPAWPRDWRVWLALFILGFTNSAIPYALISWGELHIDSAVAAILNATTPLFTMLIAHSLLHDDRITLPRLVGLLVGFAGIILLVSRDLGPGAAQARASLALLGQGAVLLASLLYAGSSVFVRRAVGGLSPVVQGLVPLVGADASFWLILSLQKGGLALPRLPLTWLAMAWLGVLGTGVAFLLYFYLIHALGPTRATLVTYIFPLVGVALGVLFLHEQLDWHLLAGGVLIVGSIVVVNRKK